MAFLFSFPAPVVAGATAFVQLHTRLDLPVAADRGQILARVLLVDGTASLCVMDNDPANTAQAQRYGTAPQFDHLFAQLIAAGQARPVGRSHGDNTRPVDAPRAGRQRRPRGRIAP